MKTVDHNKYYFGTVKWTEMFDSEAELVEMVKHINVNSFTQKDCKGYEFIQGFQRTLSNGKDLSKPQLTQLKRLAREVYKYHKDM